MARPKPAYTVTGPGLGKPYDDPGPALSRALTAACTAETDATFYVRNRNGDAVGYAERDDRIVRCVRH